MMGVPGKCKLETHPCRSLWKNARNEQFFDKELRIVYIGDLTTDVLHNLNPTLVFRR
jgi:hypothetical protein